MTTSSVFGLCAPSAAMLEVVAASCVAELVQKTALHPIDSLKVRMQYDPRRRQGGLGPRMLATEVREAWGIATAGPRPFRALYRGLGPSLLGAVPTAAVYMPSYEASKGVLGGTPLAPFAGVVTGVVSACVRVPSSVVKAQMQLGLHGVGKGALGGMGALAAILRRDGIKGLFVGFRATVALDVFYAVVQFAVLEQLRVLFAIAFLSQGDVAAAAGRGQEALLLPWHNVAIGFLTGAVTSVATEPVDVIRTRLMAQVKQGAAPTAEGAAASKGVAFGYSGVVDGLRTAVAAEGVASLWRGLLPRLLLKSLGSSLWYAVYMSARGSLDGAFGK